MSEPTTAADGGDRGPRSALVVDRRLALVPFLLALFGVVITVSFEYANHHPAPHDVRIDVVAPPTAVARVAQGLARADPGGFSVRPTVGLGTAVDELRDHRVSGALVLTSSGTARILVAGAGGSTLAGVVEKALAAAARASHRRALIDDVVPLPSADRSGTSAFFFQLGLLIPSIVGSVGLYLLGRRSRLWWRVAAAGLYALLAALCGVVVLDACFGALTGAPYAMFGIGAFGAIAVMTVALACQEWLGAAGTAIAAVLFIFVGNPMSGGTVATQLLPAGDRQLSRWTPNSGIVAGTRSVVYFGSHGVGRALVTLGAWVTAALLALALGDLVTMRERRGDPSRAAEIHATPGVALLAAARQQVREEADALARGR